VRWVRLLNIYSRQRTGGSLKGKPLSGDIIFRGIYQFFEVGRRNNENGPKSGKGYDYLCSDVCYAPTAPVYPLNPAEHFSRTKLMQRKASYKITR
jgi:hypothetical protein